MADNCSYLKGFKCPDSKYYPCTMWFWNDRILKEEVEQQIKEFKKANIYEFFIHPQWGFELDYLSDEFFELIKLAVRVAKENGMRFWIYDEYCWPSGTAGGKLLKQKPEINGKVLLTKKLTLYASQPLDTVIDGEFIGAMAFHMNYTARKEDITSRVVLSKAEGGTRVYCDLGGCSTVNVYLSYAAESVGICASGMWASFSDYQGGWLDANNKDAVRAFIDSTYERYKEAIGEEFGKTVAGVFSDEANNFSFFDNAYYTVTGSQMPVFCNPWTREFLSEFKKDNGYDFAPYAYVLSTDYLDDEVIKVRYDYWKTASHVFADNYVKQISEWCRSNKLSLTGHLSGEDSVLWHAYQMGDSYLALSEFDIPGVDNLFAAKLVDNLDYPVTDKFAATAAKLNGKPRVLSEIFSGSGWETKMQEVRRAMQRLSVCGINLSQYMGSYYSMNEGRRRFNYCYPPSHCYNTPLAGYYADVNTIMARINEVSVNSTIASKVFIVLPLISLQIDKSLQPMIDEGWRNASMAMMVTHTEYDIASERALYSAEVRDGKLTINGFTYEQVIIPVMHYSDERILKLIKKLIDEGGNVLFIQNDTVKAADTGELFDFSKDINGKNVTRVDMEFTDMNAAAEESGLAVDQVQRLPKNIDIYAFASKLQENMADCRDLVLNTDEMNIFVAHRTSGGDDLFFVDNDSGKNLTVECVVRSKRNIYIMDTEEGTVCKAETRAENGGTCFELSLGAYSEPIIVSTDRELEAEEPAKPAEMTFDGEMTLSSGWSFETYGDNWAILLTKMLPASSELIGILDRGDTKAFLDRAEADFANTGDFANFEFPGGCGLKVGDRYAAMAEFCISDMPSRLELIAETEADARIFINDTEVTEFTKIKLWGIRERKADILSLVRPGKNKLVFVANIPGWLGPHALPMSFLRGDFRLAEGTTLIAHDSAIEPDIWTKQGYLNFSGKGTYKTEFELNSVRSALLEIPTTDVVSVRLNGAELGTLLWKPYTIDITPALKRGRNTLELTFTSTYRSLMLAEEYDLFAQGYLKYCGPASPSVSGLTAAPKILIASR